MVMFFARVTQAGLVLWLVLGLCVGGVARIDAQDSNAQDSTAPAAAEPASQAEESSPEPEATASEGAAEAAGREPAEVAPEATQSAAESTSSKEADVDSETYKKKGRARARASAALAGLVILGFAMVGLTWLGARLTRRYMFGPTGQPQPTKPTLVREDDWATKPLAQRKPPPADESPSLPG